MFIWFFQHGLTFVIEMKVALVRDAFSSFAVNIRSHDLHAPDIKRAVGEIASYHKRG
jgi:hypothetical protein